MEVSWQKVQKVVKRVSARILKVKNTTKIFVSLQTEENKIERFQFPISSKNSSLSKKRKDAHSTTSKSNNEDKESGDSTDEEIEPAPKRNKLHVDVVVQPTESKTVIHPASSSLSSCSQQPTAEDLTEDCYSEVV